MSRVEPRYPKEAWIQGVRAQVVYEVHVDTSGRVVLARPVCADPPGYGFAEAGRAAIEQWRYTESSRDAVLRVTMNWTLAP